MQWMCMMFLTLDCPCLIASCLNIFTLPGLLWTNSEEQLQLTKMPSVLKSLECSKLNGPKQPLTTLCFKCFYPFWHQGFSLVSCLPVFMALSLYSTCCSLFKAALTNMFMLSNALAHFYSFTGTRLKAAIWNLSIFPVKKKKHAYCRCNCLASAHCSHQTNFQMLLDYSFLTTFCS